MSRSVFVALPLVLFLAASACTTEEASSGSLSPTRTSPSSDGGGGTKDDETNDASVVPPSSSDAGSTKDASGAPQSPTESGEATYYNAEGLGSCGVPFPSDYLVAAMNDEEYKKADCGKCVSVTGPKGTVIVRILDECPGCGPGDLDLSITAFTKIADKAAGRVPITWYFVACPF